MTTKVAYTIAEVCALASVGRTTVYQSINEGQLRAVKLRATNPYSRGGSSEVAGWNAKRRLKQRI